MTNGWTDSDVVPYNTWDGTATTFSKCYDMNDYQEYPGFYTDLSVDYSMAYTYNTSFTDNYIVQNTQLTNLLFGFNTGDEFYTAFITKCLDSTSTVTNGYSGTVFTASERQLINTTALVLTNHFNMMFKRL